jgi:hypothetical protein
MASIALALSGVALPSAQAQPTDQDAGSSAPANAKFRQLDRNADGYIQKDEVAHIRGYAYAFDEADENRDGRLDGSEFLKAESLHERAQVGNFVEDSVLTAKVKTALLRERDLKSTDIHVETYHGRVLLSGFVDGPEQRDKAVKVTSLVPGVIEVKDGLAVR